MVSNNLANLQDKQEIKNQLGEVPDIFYIPLSFTNKDVGINQLVTKQVKRNITDGFILNSSEFGVLGTNELGIGTEDYELYSVLPNGNQFKEYFGQSDYINTSASNGTLNASAETYSLTTGQILESEVIAKLRSPITSVGFINDGGGNNASIEFSNDSGTTWYSSNTVDTYVFPTSSVNDELKYRITATTTTTITPLSLKVN
jgi:hypothetical protein